MSRRSGMSRSYSRKVFRSGAGYNRKNIDPRPMRGGIRL